MFDWKRQKQLEGFFKEDLEELTKINEEINKIIENGESPNRLVEIHAIEASLEIVKIKIMATEKYILEQINHSR